MQWEVHKHNKIQTCESGGCAWWRWTSEFMSGDHYHLLHRIICEQTKQHFKHSYVSNNSNVLQNLELNNQLADRNEKP